MSADAPAGLAGDVAAAVASADAPADQPADEPADVASRGPGRSRPTAQPAAQRRRVPRPIRAVGRGIAAVAPTVIGIGLLTVGLVGGWQIATTRQANQLANQAPITPVAALAPAQNPPVVVSEVISAIGADDGNLLAASLPEGPLTQIKNALTGVAHVRRVVPAGTVSAGDQTVTAVQIIAEDASGQLFGIDLLIHTEFDWSGGLPMNAGSVRGSVRSAPGKTVDAAKGAADHTRFIANRNLRRLFILLAVLTILVIAFGLQAMVAQAIGMVASLPQLAISLAFAASYIIFQFGILFWFLSRPRKYTITPDDPQIGMSFENYRGQPDLLEHARSTVNILQGVKEFEVRGGEMPKGMLLAGRPGTGKTFLAACIAAEANLPFIYIDASSLRGMFWGMTELMVIKLFRDARGLARKYAEKGKRGAASCSWTRSTRSA